MQTPYGQALVESDPTSPSPPPSPDSRPHSRLQSSHHANRPITPPHPQTRRSQQTRAGSEHEEDFVDTDQDYAFETDGDTLVERGSIDERRETAEPDSTATMALDMAQPPAKKKKHNIGGAKPIDTMNRGAASVPAWLPKTTQPRSIKPSNPSNLPFRSPLKRVAGTPIQRDEERSASHYRTSHTSRSSSEFPESGNKRIKTSHKTNGQNGAHNSVDMSDDGKARPVRPARALDDYQDGLNGQSQQFRSVEAMVRSSRTSTSGSRNSSQTDFSRRKLGVEKLESYHFATMKVHSTTRFRDVDVQMQDDEIPIKAVHLTRADVFNGANPGSIEQVEVLASRSGAPFRRKDTNSSTFIAHGPLQSSRRPTTNGKGRDVQPLNGLNESDDLLGSDDIDQLAAEGSDEDGMTPVGIHPDEDADHLDNPPSKMKRTAPPSQTTEDAVSDRPSQLRHQFTRDETKRESRDQSDPLQADSATGPISLLEGHTAIPKRKKNPSRVIQALAERKNSRQTLSIGDGFDSDELSQNNPKHELRKSKKQLNKASSSAVSTEVKVPHTAWHATYLNDCGVELEGPYKIWNVNQLRRFEYMAANKKHGTIDPIRINRVEWGKESHVRLTGGAQKGKVYEVRIVFEDVDSFHNFKAGCTRFGLRDAKSSRWLESSDEKLAKIFGRPLVYGQEEAGVIARKHARQDDREHDSSRPSGYKTIQGEKSGAMRARLGAGSQANTSRSRSTRSTTSYGQAGFSRDATPEPKVLYSRTGALGPRWKQSLVFPPGGARNNVATVDFDDLERLDEDEFLNDNLISFGLRWAFEKASQDVKDKVHIFNTYFYTSMTNQPKKGSINHDAVKKWTLKLASKRGLFEHDYVVVPINESYHWHVAIICNVKNIGLHPDSGEYAASSRPQMAVQSSIPPTRQTRQRDAEDRLPVASPHRTHDIVRKTSQLTLEDDDGDEGRAKRLDEFLENGGIHKHKKDDEPSKASGVPAKGMNRSRSKNKDPSLPVIITLDSFGGAHPDVVRNLKEYLRQEAVDKHDARADPMPAGLTAKGIPLQPNFSDCGLYVIAYIEQFLKDPEGFVARAVNREMELAEHWPDFDATTLRDRCRDIALGEGKRQNGFTLTEAEKVAINKTNMTPNVYTTTPSAGSSILLEAETNGTGSRRASPKQTEPQSPAAETTSEERSEGSDDEREFYNGFTSKLSSGDQHQLMDKRKQSQRHTSKQCSSAPHQPNESGGNLLAGIENYATTINDADDADDNMILGADEPVREPLANDYDDETAQAGILKTLSRGFPRLMEESGPRIKQILKDYQHAKGGKSRKEYRPSPKLQDA